MLRCCVAFLLFVIAATPAELLNDAFQSYWTAWQSGKFTEAEAQREQLRQQVTALPTDDPQFGNMTSNLAQLYANSAMTGRARAILQNALQRSSKLAESDPARVQLLAGLAASWENEGNLLQALVYWRQVVAAGEKSPPMPRLIRRPPGYESTQLAGLLRRLGRPDEASAVTARFLSLADERNRDLLQAQAYEQNGDLDQAAAIYKRKAEEAIADPQNASLDAASALQMLANVYQREQRFSDAVDALQRAVAVVSSPSAPEGVKGQALWLQQNVASVLTQAGQTDSADRIYQQLLTETPKNQDGQYEQVLMTYANHLAQTNRGDSAESMLNDYLAGASNLQPQEEVNLLYTLSNVAGQAGHADRAQAYQKSAQEKQQSLLPEGAAPHQNLVTPDLERAQAEANEGHNDEALALAWKAMAAAPTAVDRENIPGLISNLARIVKPEQAEKLFQSLFGLVESWRGETLQPLLNARQNYFEFVLQTQRFEEAKDAMDRYRDALESAHGAGSGTLANLLRMTIQVERIRDAKGKTLAAAEDLLSLEESVTGNTSQPYLNALEVLANTQEWIGEGEGALSLRLKAVKIADLVFTKMDLQRGQVRINTAFALARLGQFEEAERMGQEAAAIALENAPGQGEMYDSQLEQIRTMKVTALAALKPPQ